MGRYCVKCDLEAKAAEIERLRAEKDQYEKRWQATVDRVASLETALDYAQDDYRKIVEKNKRLRAENSLLLTCHGFVEYDVRDMMEPCEPPEPSDCQPNEADMM